MKNIFTLLLFVIATSLHAQPTFYGVSDYAVGRLFRYQAGANSLGTVYKHQVNEVFPTGTLSKGPDGQLYGMTLSGGGARQGAIFRYNTSTGAYTTLYQFDETSGSQPTGVITWGSNGLLYGLTTYGGQYNNGVLFSFDPKSLVYKVLYQFNGTDGANPTGGLTAGSNGKLYGLTQLGGVNEDGVLFSFNTLTGLYKKQADFDEASGAYPEGSLTKGPDGLLYGATAFGGADWWQAGSIFRYNPAKDTLGHLYYFNASDVSGYGAVGSFTFMPDGKLFGATSDGGTNGGGVIFRFDPVRSRYKVLYNLAEQGGVEPAGGLVASGDGKLVGITRRANTNDHGGIFTFDPATLSFTNLYAFAATDGYDHAGALCLGTDGRMYGVAPFGGSTEYGTLFTFNKATKVFSKLKEFDEAPDGMYPVAAPAPHTDGLLYGSTVNGGHYGKGVIYAFNPASQTYQTVFRFSQEHGQYMGAAFTRGTGGKLYGMLSSGGANGSGQIFSFDPAGKVVQVLYNFDYANGAYPEGALLPADGGGMFGVTTAGGTANAGTVFQFDPATLVYTAKASFDGTNGSMPMDGLTRGANNKLYGITQLGGAANLGTLYAFDPAAGSISKLFEFSGSNGANPLRGLVLAANKKLYGTTPSGGKNNLGVLYSFDPASSQFAVLFHFDGPNGAHPSGRLSLGADGKMYGVTREGGVKGKGVVFVLDPATGSVAKTKDFDGSGTANSITSALSEYCSQLTAFYRDQDGDGYGAGSQTLLACSVPPGYAANNTDCNDAVAAIHPGATEICGNGIDDNCNGQVDEQCGSLHLSVVSTMTVKEQDGQAKLVFQLSQPATKEIKLHYRTESGSAKAGLDFASRAGLIKLPKGSSSVTVFIPVYRDQQTEEDENFKVYLFDPKGVTLDQTMVRITIRDKSAQPSGNFAAPGLRPAGIMEEGAPAVTAYPNPSATGFQLVPSFKGSGPVTLTVSDATGKIIEVRRGLPAAQPIRIGAQYHPGMYLVDVVQDGVSVRLKLLKQAQ
ncbi:Por secretion system C-terminal sorting domain-containing protein [Cnuella takakiae]|uniref:Por secretion system C-terminal sorting domain-containing protein n=1 Tax=Cnuella takakiae TaxID=1302690 RepID=A0A1M5B2S7_9BACT|nr:choice-of-anchor tandem repeat GloVer-containing protein [Cnuella takakiae]OLY93312.1 hypothetical protein BUE76_16540 [Cnuella takakiae]SHF36803.1 Por secretion system C-terminal sorting domain-containing protein [Cnuella takakiae]